jgi:polyferredoxin/tetratricopeptide (TPR) repeat protein
MDKMAKNQATCTHRSMEQRGAISLPVLTEHNPRGQIRKSRSGKRRAIVLAAVQLLILAHILLWVLSRTYDWFGGRTITPVEPSESMEFSKHGVINAGLIFFSLALLATLILGRWFCGWGCHIVMLQDLCGWIMKKCGVRPKVFRSRFLVYVPLLLALYMFIMPVVHRVGLIPLDDRLASSLGSDNWLVHSLRTMSGLAGFPLGAGALPQWKATFEVTTDDFWKTFPGTYTAYFVVPIFLFVCGFAVVYFLGAKGFCTYGCPYGGFFAPLDKLAPGRILVTDACEGCGHCTAVCTSNVRVHEEVREYGMVVDPGCMKCLDCVSVCPNDALYFGFAKPAIMKGPAKTKAPKRIYDMTLREEFACAGVFALTFFSTRGVYGLVPMLMAAGLAGIVTFLAWKLSRLIRDPNVTLHRFQLKLRGAMRRSGWVFAVLAVAALVLTVHSGAVNAALMIAQRNEAKVVISLDRILAPEAEPMPAEMAAAADRALRHYRFALPLGAGGIGLLPTMQNGRQIIEQHIAELLLSKRQFRDAERVLRGAIARQGEQDHLCATLMWTLVAQQRGDEAMAFAENALLLRADMNFTLDVYVQLAGMAGDTERVISICRRRLERFPDHLHTLRKLSIVLVQGGIYEEGVAMIRRTIEIDPNEPSAYTYLASALRELEWYDEAIVELERGLKRFPDHYQLNVMLADMLSNVGRDDLAEPYRQRAMELHQRATHQH